MSFEHRVHSQGVNDVIISKFRFADNPLETFQVIDYRFDLPRFKLRVAISKGSCIILRVL